MEHPDSAAAEGARAAIAPLHQRVLGWMDADRVLPADGSSLLAALERALEGWTGEDPAAARAAIAAFIRRVEALIAAGVLEAEDGRARIEAAAAMAALLRSTMGTDLETRRRRRDTL
jgi:hypothetical protein